MTRRAQGKISRAILRCVVPATVAVATLFSLPAFAAPSISIGPDVNVSRTTNNQSEMGIAINPTNPNNVVIVSNLEFGTGLFEGYSFDGGSTWTQRKIADGGALGHACCDPTLSWDEFGNLFLSYIDVDDPSIPVALSTDGGVTFQALARVPHRANGRSVSTDQPTITSGAGSVWVSFFGPRFLRAAGAAVTGLGAANIGHFSGTESAPGSDRSGGCNYGDISVGPNGQVMVTCQIPQDFDVPSTIYVNVDPDGLGPQGFGLPVTIATNGAGGFDFIPAQAGRSVDAEAGLAWDRTGGPHRGRVYLIYTREKPNESDDMDVLLLHSDNDGQSWSSPIRVNDDPGRRSQFMPRVALDQVTGNLAFSWYDARADAGRGGPADTDGKPNTDARFFTAISTDGGLSVSANARVSDGTSNSSYAHNGIDFGDYTGLDFHGGVYFPSWSDNSNSTGDNPDGTLTKLDVYTARVSLT